MHFVRGDAQSYGVLIVDCAPDSKEYNMKCDFVVSRGALEAPCSWTLDKRLMLVVCFF